jgi:hypothetical protein
MLREKEMEESNFPIMACNVELIPGKVVTSSLTDAKGDPHNNITYRVIKEATKEDYLRYHHKEDLTDSELRDLEIFNYFYYISMD